MVTIYRSRFPDFEIPNIDLISFLLENPNNISDDKIIYTDIYTKETLTYAQIKDGIFQFAAGLQDQYGFKKGDVLGLFAPNSAS